MRLVQRKDTVPNMKQQEQRRSFISLREAARLLRFDEHSVRRAIWRGAIRAAKTGGRWRIPLHEIRRYAVRSRGGVKK